MSRCGDRDRVGTSARHVYTRSLGVAAAHSVHHCLWRVRVDSLRWRTNEHLVQQQAEGVHVARRGQHKALYLLRTRVRRRHDSEVCPRDGLVDAGQFSIEQLGDPKIEQLDPPIARHEDIARLQITVQDEVLMRVCTAAHTSLKSRSRASMSSP